MGPKTLIKFILSLANALQMVVNINFHKLCILFCDTKYIHTTCMKVQKFANRTLFNESVKLYQTKLKGILESKVKDAFRIRKKLYNL